MSAKSFFQDQVIIITGASSGIGRASALLFADLQARVVLTSRNIEKPVPRPGIQNPAN